MVRYDEIEDRINQRKDWRKDQQMLDGKVLRRIG